MEQKVNLEIEITDDGSATILVPEINEHYHSVRGALTESNHIYRDSAFLHRCNMGGTARLRLLEIGFGTGLNAVVTAMVANEQNPVHYITLEKYPLDSDLTSQLNYNKLVDKDLYRLILEAEWNNPVAITPYFTLEKRSADYLTADLPSGIDVVYFDAFAPEKQPEMWSAETFGRLVNTMNSGAVLTTYCSKGVIRRLLESLGLTVERIAGPAGGKREILRATTPLIPQPC